MKKTYNLGYEKGKYYLEYSMPKNDESIEIIIDNKIDENNDEQVRKKGARVCATIQSLCDEICKEINKKCFKD